MSSRSACGHPHNLVGCLRLAYECRFERLLFQRCGRVQCRLFLELPELQELIEEDVVDPNRTCGEYLATTLGDPEVASAGALGQACLADEGRGPMYPVAEQRLLTRQEEFRPILGRELELFCQPIDDLADGTSLLAAADKTGSISDW